MYDIINKLGFLAGGSKFRRIYEKMQIGGDKVYKDARLNFKSTWFPVYYVLTKTQKPQSIMEIANQIAFSHITVKNIVKELEEEALINIEPNPKDKRSKLISLSKTGIELLNKLQPIWLSFSNTLEKLLTSGHPDILNILNRIDKNLSTKPLNERIKFGEDEPVFIMDYKPSLKKHFFDLAGYWLLGILKGKLEKEDKFTLHNPDKAYLEHGGFVFFAQYKKEIVGCVALKRLNEDTFEFAKLFVDPKYRGIGIARKLIERCICRCKENAVTELWLQSAMSMKQAHNLYYKMGFKDQKAPAQMEVLKRTEKIMYIDL